MGRTVLFSLQISYMSKKTCTKMMVIDGNVGYTDYESMIWAQI